MSFSSKSKPGFHIKDPYPNTHKTIFDVFGLFLEEEEARRSLEKRNCDIFLKEERIGY